MAERVTLTGVIIDGEVNVPVRLDDGTWMVHDSTGTCYYDSAADVRASADRWEQDPEFSDMEADAVAGMRMLADVMDEAER